LARFGLAIAAALPFFGSEAALPFFGLASAALAFFGSAAPLPFFGLAGGALALFGSAAPLALFGSAAAWAFFDLAIVFVFAPGLLAEGRFRSAIRDSPQESARSTSGPPWSRAHSRSIPARRARCSYSTFRPRWG
jgi:hypothetical protein